MVAKLLTLQHIYICMYVCMYVCMYILIYCGVIIWAKFSFLRCYYLGQVCFLQNIACQEKTIRIGVSAHCFQKQIGARKFEVLLSGPSWPFLSCSGPDNNTYLAQIITPQNGIFSLAYKNVLKYLFYSAF